MGALLPVYIALGDDELKRLRVLDKLRERLEMDNNSSMNHNMFDADKDSIEDVIETCNIFPLGSEYRLVELSSVDLLKKKDSEALISYLASPSATTILALTAEKLARNTRLYKTIAGFGKNSIIDCAVAKRYELVNQIRQMAKGYRMNISQAAAELLFELKGFDTIAIDSELRKLSLMFAGRGVVTDEHIKKLVVRTSAAKPWDFVDGFASRDINKAIKAYREMIDMSPFALLQMSVKRIRELLCVKSLHARGDASSMASVLKVPAWSVKNYRTWSTRYSEKELIEALTLARDCEKAMKSTSHADDAFFKWVLHVMSR